MKRASSLGLTVALVANATALFGCGSAPPADDESVQRGAEELVSPKCAWPMILDCEDPAPSPHPQSFSLGSPVCQCVRAPVPLITSLAAGSQTTYAIDTLGDLFAWGANTNCALGLGASSSPAIGYPRPLFYSQALGDIDQPQGARQVAAGDTGACALFDDDTAKCWGTITSTGAQPVSYCTPTAITALPAVTQIAHGTSHACAIDTNQFVWCWGDDQYGQLGDSQPAGVGGVGSTTAVPVLSPLINRVLQIVAGGNTTCVRRIDNAVFCWGDDSQGGLGDASGAGKSVLGPLQVGNWTMANGSGGASSLFGGGRGTFCGRDAWTNKVLCWGANESGQAALQFEPAPNGDVCGNGLGCAPSPSLMVSSMGPFIALGKNHSCAGGTTIPGGLSMLGCVGSGSSGQLGTGSLASSFVPVAVAAPSGPPVWFSQFVVGDNHTCGIAAPSATYQSIHSNVFCWGDGTRGQLGAGPTGNSAIPQAVTWN